MRTLSSYGINSGEELSRLGTDVRHEVCLEGKRWKNTCKNNAKTQETGGFATIDVETVCQVI